MKNIKDFGTLFLSVIIFVLMSKSAVSQSLSDIEFKSNKGRITLWNVYGDSQKLEMNPDSTLIVFTFDNLKYQHISDWGFIIFDSYGEMIEFFIKLQEMIELPNPKKGDSYSFSYNGIKVSRGPNTLGVANLRISVDGKWTWWNTFKNKKVLQIIS